MKIRLYHEFIFPVILSVFKAMYECWLWSIQFENMLNCISIQCKLVAEAKTIHQSPNYMENIAKY